jgi:hypothetical protein
MDMQNRFVESKPICVTRFRLVLVSLFVLLHNYAPRNPIYFSCHYFFSQGSRIAQTTPLVHDMNSPGKSCATINYYVTAHIHRKITLELIEA